MQVCTDLISSSSFPSPFNLFPCSRFCSLSRYMCSFCGLSPVIWIFFFLFFSCVLRDSTPRFVGPSVRSSVCPSHVTFLSFCGLWPHCSCPSGKVTSNTAPAHPHATGVAVYPALLKKFLIPTLGQDKMNSCPNKSVNCINFYTRLMIMVNNQDHQTPNHYRVIQR